MKKLLLILIALAVGLGAGYRYHATFPYNEPSPWSQRANPSALTAAEESLARVHELAALYNPAMAFPTRDLWPVDVSYAWHDGADLMARITTRTGIARTRRAVEEYVALANELLESDSAWASLPNHDEGGNEIEYFVSVPGDDRRPFGVTGWVQRWREIMGHDSLPVTETPYPPTQYAHVFWFNRDEGLLGIQYWFYYPFNEWINHHEGDWENINIILQGPSELTPDARFEPVGYQFFFHDWMYEPQEVMRIAGDDPFGDHVLIYAGGRSRFFLWTGKKSGGSYPLPGVFPGAGGGLGKIRPHDDTRAPQRFIHPREFEVVVLPEPERLDLRENPELAWFQTPLLLGQHEVYNNPFFLRWLGLSHVPMQPGRRDDWNAGAPRPHWPGEDAIEKAPVRLPPDWRILEHGALKRPGA